MAKLPIEVEFVAAVWNLAASRDVRLQTYADFLPPEAVQHADLAATYQYLLERWALDKPVDDEEATEALSAKLGARYQRVLQLSYDWEAKPRAEWLPRDYAKRIARHWQTRKQRQVLADAAREAERLEGMEEAEGAEHARQLGDRVVSDIVRIHSSFLGKSAVRTRDEIADQELALIHKRERHGVRWPYGWLNKILGPLLPGKVYGLTGYPGTGKTQLTVNIVHGLLLAGNPVIVIPTEMELDFQRRLWGLHGGLHQRLVEHQMWDTATPEELARYAEAINDLRGVPLELVTEPDLTPDAIMARVRVLRRLYPGRHVILVIDHMYDLKYPNDEAEKHVAVATRALRLFAAADREGGMSVVCVYQPRKPGDEEAIFHAVRAHQVKGAQIWNQVYAHFSPFRRWVKADQYNRTPWGSPSCTYGDDGYPLRCDPDDPMGKVDDEHVYIKPDKARSGGEGPLFMLDIDAPTGLIYDRTPLWDGHPILTQTYNRHRDILCQAA